MQLSKKKALAAKVLGVGKDRIIFSSENLPEIKEAITRQDIRDLRSSGAIKVREVAGRKKNVKRKHRRRTGRVKMNVNTRKQEYVKLTRKLRKFLRHLIKTDSVEREENREMRKMIKSGRFKSKRHFKESWEDL